jgi:hypothetical protein
VVVELADQPVQRARGVTGTEPAAGRVGRAPGQEAGQCAAQRGRLPAVLLVRVQGLRAGVEHAVENQRPDPVREEVRVDRAEERAVRQAEEGELPLPQRGPEPVQVARDGTGADVRQQPAGVADAGGDQPGRPAERLADPVPVRTVDLGA